MKLNELITAIGNTDIYLLDQIMKGNTTRVKKILDAGCGTGRNLVWFLQQPVHVTAMDPDPNNLEFIKQKVLPSLKLECHSLVTVPSTIETFVPETGPFDFIICNAVLHFARSKEHFEQMLNALWAVLDKDGILFMRLASDIGIEKLVKPLEGHSGVYLLPDGTERYLITHHQIMEYTQQLGAQLVDPVKTTNVQNKRAMTTWILRKN